MNFKKIDCCPVPDQLYPILKAIKDETNCTYNSIYRGEDPNAQRFLTGGPPCYKHNQAWIYSHYPPGTANPPGYSTHELRNDGVAFTRWRRGGSIPWWACGIDVDDGHVQAFIHASMKRGWIATVTYPNSRVEYHHVNFRKMPILNIFKNLKQGMRGPRVWIFCWRLYKLGFINKPTAHFIASVTQAVKKFQKKYRLHSDGVVGLMTWNQIAVQYRYMLNHRKKK